MHNKGMESIFLLDSSKRASFLRILIRSFGFTHISLWSYSPFPSNCLMSLDGLYHQQPNPSTSTAAMLFAAYRDTLNYIINDNQAAGKLPGFAFKNCLPYIHMNLDSLLKMASTQVQIHFYKEAGIKSVAFIGCAAGEVELGMPWSEPPENLKTEMDKWFHQYIDMAQLYSTSSSSPINSLSVESTDYLDIPTSTDALLLEQVLFEDQETLDPVPAFSLREDSTHAFTRYCPRPRSLAAGYPPKPNNIFKRAVMFYRDFNTSSGTPTSTQLHHMISERRRREKLNEGFQVLKALLPPGSKKDKASILSTTTDLLASLKSQVEELTKRNQELESQIAAQPKVNEGIESTAHRHSPSKGGVVKVEMKRTPASDASGCLDLRVGLRSGQCGMLEMVNEVLELVRQERDVLTLVYLQSKTKVAETNPTYCLVLRLRLEGQDFDESDFQQAVRRRMGALCP